MTKMEPTKQRESAKKEKKYNFGQKLNLIEGKPNGLSSVTLNLR
jgi:hypothetical protein